VRVSDQIGALREEFKSESGLVSRMMPAVLGPVLLWSSRREEKRLARGKTYEPPTILERRNWAKAFCRQSASALRSQHGYDRQSDQCQSRVLKI